jgi:hypothetical protein
MVTAWWGVDLALFQNGLPPFGWQVAGLPCPCLRRSDGRNPNLDGWTALDHLSGVGCPTRSVSGFRCGCGSMVWSGYGAEQRQVKAVRPVRQDGPAQSVRSGHRIGPAFGCGGQGPCPGRKRQDVRLCLAGGSCCGTMACHDARRCDNPVAAPQARHRRGGAYAGGKPVSSPRPARGKRGFGLRPGQGAMTQGRRPDAAGPDNRKGPQ